ncbi:uncharacterized protein LOC135461646 [Liolophura sinensis]|uniref:uncharacterized protein LOC135461646 n=1 Tax=Liolophura sinensis TaxID=3198878 RepID=UPI0031596049
MSSDFTFNLLYLNNNQFVWYAVAGVVAVMGLVFVLSVAYSSGKNKVKLIKNPNPNGFTLQRYALAFKTSSAPGSGLSERVSVRVSITGQKGSTRYVSLSRPLYPNDTLSRGNDDVFLLHFERGVGEVQHVHLYMENYDFQDNTWFLKEVNVYDPQKQKKWHFPVNGILKISGGKREQRFLIDGNTSV